VTKATQAGRGNVPMIQGHQRLPQKNGVHHRPKLVAVPDSFVQKQTDAAVEEIFILRNCIICKQQTRSWGSVNHGEDCVCSKDCYDEYISRQEKTRIRKKVNLVQGQTDIFGQRSS
jgi:hypothetical protein